MDCLTFLFCSFFIATLTLFSTPGWAQMSDFEKKIYPEVLLNDEDFQEARASGQRASSEAITAFESLLNKYPREQYPKAHLAVEFLLGAATHPYDQGKALDIYISALRHSAPYPELHSRLLARKARAMTQRGHPEAVEAGRDAYDFTIENGFPEVEQLNALTHYFSALHRSNDLQACHKLLAEYDRLLEACDDPEVKHSALSQLARFFFETGIQNKAADYVERDLNLCLEAFGDSAFATANAYMTVGIVASQARDHEKEIYYYEKAAEMLNYLISEKQYHHYAVSINLAHAYNNLEKADRGYEHLLKSLDILENITPRNDPERSDVYASLAMHHAFNGDPDSVFFYTGRVKEIFDGKDHALKVQSYSTAGGALYEIGQIKKSREFHDELIAMVDAHYGGKHFYKGKALLLKAAEESDPIKKMVFLDEALEATHPDYKAGKGNPLPAPAGFLDKTVAANILSAKAEISAKTATTEEALLSLLDLVNSGIEVLDAMHEEQLSSASVRTSKTAAEFYALGLETLETLYDKTGDREHLAAAYLIFQKSKGHLLGQFIKEKELLAGAADSVKQEAIQLREERLLIEQEVAGGETEGQSQARLAEIDFRLNQLKDEIRASDPSYFNYLLEPASLSLEEARVYFQSADATGLEYFTGQDKIFMMAVSGKNTVLKSRNVDPGIARRAEQLLTRMREMTAAEFAREAHYFYQNLFEPIEDDIADLNVVVVPDGWMARLPLEILVNSEVSGSPGFNELDYLIRDRGFSYLYSADMLAARAAEKKQRPDRNLYLGVAPGFDGDRNEVAQVFRGENSRPALLGAQSEVEKAAKIFKQQVRSSEQDLEGLIKREGSAYEILHLATHADIDEASPLNSRIYLGDGSGANTDDGILHQYELFNLDLDNELTVLSACETGAGPWIDGEGVNSLARGFIYAGSKSIVLSYWDVHDRTSSVLMEDFFRNIKSGKGRSEALRDAKLNYLRKADAVQANPYYWAGFVLFGDTSPLQAASASADYWLYLIPILALLAIAVAFRTARKRQSKSRAS